MDAVNVDSDMAYPVLVIPKKNTSSNSYINNLQISIRDSEGKLTCFYDGYCHIKEMDSSDKNTNQVNSTSSVKACTDDMPIILSEVNQLLPPVDQSQIWIDPCMSPLVYNHYTPSIESYFNYEPKNLTTVEQDSTNTTQTVNTNESNGLNYTEIPPSQVTNIRDEFESGVLFSQLSDEIMNESMTTDWDEMLSLEDNIKLMDDIKLPDDFQLLDNIKLPDDRVLPDKTGFSHKENSASKQLLSSNTQTASKPRKRGQAKRKSRTKAEKSGNLTPLVD